MKKSEPKVCEWCGTRLRPPRKTRPRGPFCASEQANHEALMERIRTAKNPLQQATTADQ